MEISNDDSFTGQLHLGTITFAQMAPGLTVKGREVPFYVRSRGGGIAISKKSYLATK